MGQAQRLQRVDAAVSVGGRVGNQEVVGFGHGGVLSKMAQSYRVKRDNFGESYCLRGPWIFCLGKKIMG